MLHEHYGVEAGSAGNLSMLASAIMKLLQEVVPRKGMVEIEIKSKQYYMTLMSDLAVNEFGQTSRVCC